MCPPHQMMMITMIFMLVVMMMMITIILMVMMICGEANVVSTSNDVAQLQLTPLPCFHNP